jgi:hypothetical protein
VVYSVAFDIKMNRSIKLNVKSYTIADKWYIEPTVNKRNQPIAKSDIPLGCCII